LGIFKGSQLSKEVEQNFFTPATELEILEEVVSGRWWKRRPLKRHDKKRILVSKQLGFFFCYRSAATGFL